MFNELAAIFYQSKKSDDLAETSQSSVPEISQPPSTATTSVVPSEILLGAGPCTFESLIANIFHEESQIQVLRDLFKVCQLPNSRQIRDLSSHTGLTPKKIKNWFKNKRVQERAKIEGPVILALREVNSKLRSELDRYKEAHNKTICPHCGKSITLGEAPLSLSSSFPLPSNTLDFTVGSSDLPQSSYAQDDDVTWIF